MKKATLRFTKVLTILVLAAALLVAAGMTAFADQDEPEEILSASVETLELSTEELQEPLPEPEPFTGFKEIDGEWFYLVNDEVQSEFTGVIEGELDGENAHWYVKDGKVSDFTGFAYDGSKWIYIESGEFRDGLTNIKKGVVNGQTAWWYIKNGVVTFTDTVAKNDTGWWKVTDGKIDFSFTGFAENETGWWYVEKGKVITNKNDVIKGDAYGENAWWYVKGGKITLTDTAAKNKNGWWVIKSGKVDFSVNGFYFYNGGWWLVNGGKLRTDKTDIVRGTAYEETADWYVKGGKITLTDTLAKNSKGWWKIKSGKIDTGFSGFTKYNNGWWYVENGFINTTDEVLKYGPAYDYEAWWFVKKGKVALDNTVAKNEDGWWAVEGGRVTFTFNGIIRKAANSFWYAENSKITLKKTAIVSATIEGRKGQYYVKNSKVVSGNTLCVVDGKEYCIVDGIVNTSYTGYLQNKDEGTWWYIVNGVKSESLASKITSKLFVIVDCDEQHVYLVENGKTVYSTPCVTGNVKHHNMTKRGLFSIYSKETNRDLKGRDYVSHVNYWMPFDGNRGLHDAKWKKTFGGTEYLLHGSHGCVNMPMDAGEYVYKHVKVGTKVLVFGGKQSL